MTTGKKNTALFGSKIKSPLSVAAQQIVSPTMQGLQSPKTVRDKKSNAWLLITPHPSMTFSD